MKNSNVLNKNFCYVPILKWKKAEIGALKELYDKHKNLICPLIQIIPKEKKDDDLETLINRFESEQLHEIRKKVIEIWGERRIFVNFNLLYSVDLKLKSMKTVMEDDLKNKGFIAPVIHLSDDETIKKYAFSFSKKNNRELCLRITPADFGIGDTIDVGKANSKIKDILGRYTVDEELVNLVIDVGNLASNTSLYNKYFNASQEIYSIHKWKTIIFSGGSFLKDLSTCKRDEDNVYERFEWMSWKNQVVGNKLNREPIFSDYTIQFPIYEQRAQFFQPSCSIRYTFDDYWWVLRGKKGGFDQYLVHVHDLVKDKRYSGEDFSFGDKYIKEKADHFLEYMKDPKIKGTGNAETWLKTGINHHLTVVVTQVSSLNDKR